jgi:hypothetical protein
MSADLTRDDIEHIRGALAGNRIKAHEAGEQHLADALTKAMDYQFNALCDLALRSLGDARAEPVALGKMHEGRYIAIGIDDLAKSQPAWVQEKWANADKLYLTAPPRSAGYVLVPVEPTEEMITAYLEAQKQACFEFDQRGSQVYVRRAFVAGYKAMLTASSPGAGGEEKA